MVTLTEFGVGLHLRVVLLRHVRLFGPYLHYRVLCDAGTWAEVGTLLIRPSNTHFLFPIHVAKLRVHPYRPCLPLASWLEGLVWD